MYLRGTEARCSCHRLKVSLKPKSRVKRQNTKQERIDLSSHLKTHSHSWHSSGAKKTITGIEHDNSRGSRWSVKPQRQQQQQQRQGSALRNTLPLQLSSLTFPSSGYGAP